MGHIFETTYLLQSSFLHQFPIKPTLILPVPINLDPQCSLFLSKFLDHVDMLISVVCDAYPTYLVQRYLTL